MFQKPSVGSYNRFDVFSTALIYDVDTSGLQE